MSDSLSGYHWQRINGVLTQVVDTTARVITNPTTTTTVPKYTYTVPTQPLIMQSAPNTTTSISPVSDSCQNTIQSDNSSQASVPVTTLSNEVTHPPPGGGTSSIDWGVFVILGILVIIMLIVVK